MAISGWVGFDLDGTLAESSADRVRAVVIDGTGEHCPEDTWR